MIVGCSDGAVYVWQMETGHLDRVLHGLFAPRCFTLPCHSYFSNLSILRIPQIFTFSESWRYLLCLYIITFLKLCLKFTANYVHFLGIIAEEVLYACDENTIAAAGGSAAGGELGLANPAVHFFR